MKARGRNAVTVLVLLACAAGAFAYAYFGVQRKGEKDAAAQAEQEKIFHFDPQKAKALTIDKLKMVRSGEVWHIVSPVETDTEAGAVKQVLDQLLTQKRKAEILPAGASEADLARYGLAKPATLLELELEGGKTETYALGKVNGLDGSLYARANGGAVLAVVNNKYALEKGLFQLREKRLVHLEEKDLKRVEVKAPKLSYVLERDGADWKLTAPIAEPADPNTVRNVITAVRGLTASEFVDAPGPDQTYGLDKPKFLVKMTTSAGALWTTSIGESPEKPAAGSPKSLYALVSGEKRVLAKISDVAAKELDQELMALRDKTVVAFDGSKASALHIESGGQVIELQKKAAAGGGTEGSWSLTAPRVAQAKQFQANNLVSVLSSFRAAGISDETGKKAAEFGLDHPSRVVAVLGSDGKELGRLELGKESKDLVYARGSAGKGRIFTVEKTRLSSIPKTAGEIVETTATAGK